MTKARLNANLMALLSLGGSALLYKFPPTENAFYPTCLIHRYLHVYCPGCGATRALAALLQGRLTEAIHYNPLFVALLPLLVALAASAYWSAMTKDEVRWAQLPKPALALLVAIVAVFGVARNF
jgi:uncharacterized protein DUF2752